MKLENQGYKERHVLRYCIFYFICLAVEGRSEQQHNKQEKHF